MVKGLVLQRTQDARESREGQEEVVVLRSEEQSSAKLGSWELLLRLRFNTPRFYVRRCFAEGFFMP